MSRKKFTAEYEANLLDPSVDPVDRANAIDCMISDELRLHEALVISLLEDPSEYLRSSALKAVIHWDTRGYFPLLRDRLRNDPSSWVRGLATIRAVWVAKNFPSYKEELLRMLAHAVDHDPANDVSCDAYQAFVIVATGSPARQHIDEETFDRKRDVDANLIGPYRSAPTSKVTAS